MIKVNYISKLPEGEALFGEKIKDLQIQNEWLKMAYLQVELEERQLKRLANQLEKEIKAQYSEEEILDARMAAEETIE
jgi:hypothetical protein